jgi:heme-degrading monooxygenase HmoA
MRATWGRVEPGRWSEYEAAYRRGATDAGRPDGLVSHRLLRDLDDPDTGFTTLLFATRQAMDSYEGSTNRATRLAPIQPFFPGAFVVNRLELVIDEEFS